MRPFWRKSLEMLGQTAQFVCVAHCIFEYVGSFVVCSGPSMEPTIFSDNILFTEHVSPRLRTISRGDIVIVRYPSDPTQNICKRVIGLPGDRVHSKIVPLGHVWLEGDNRNNSNDSRSYGPVPQGLVFSRAVCRIWPANSFKLLF